MKLKSRILGTVGIAAAVATATVALPATANAAVGYDRCPSGHACLFSGANGSGSMAYFRYGSPDLRGQSMDNTAESIWNRAGAGALIYTGYNYSGENDHWGSGARGNLSVNGFANVASSIRVG
ncbi:peptidase inhibitor family I36 protein [Spirillospora sp. CA-294931]|uniref:peptidase inhibitor family I36 protein n=1 Tax=Spirillospora sp. CA-294931 TaxID=3240042 RepID=UPI003D8B279A